MPDYPPDETEPTATPVPPAEEADPVADPTLEPGYRPSVTGPDQGQEWNP